MNETLKNVAIVSGALIVGAGVGMTIDGETPIEPAPIVEEIVKEEIKGDLDSVVISLPDEKVKSQK